MQTANSSLAVALHDQDDAITWALSHCAGAIAQGLPLEKLLRESLVPTSREDGWPDHISPNQFALLCINLILMLEDELQGSASKSMPVGSVAMGVRVMLGAEHLEQGLQYLLRFFHLSSPCYLSKLEVEGDVATLALAIEGSGASSSLPGEEILIAAVHMYMSWFAGRTVPVLSAITQRPDHPGLRSSRDVLLKCPTQLGERTAIRFPKACLGWRRKARDHEQPVTSSVRFAINNIWNAPRFGHPTAVPESGYAGAVVRALEADAGASLADIADALRLAPITLWRYLRNEGTSFLELRRAWLVRVAIERLCTTDITTEDLAEELGFSDARSLRHSIKRITGATPSDIRSSRFDPVAWEREQDMVTTRIMQLCGALEA